MRVVQQLRQWAESLLVPAQSVCLLCKRPSRQLVNRRISICMACADELPRIRKVVCTTCGRAADCHDCARREQTYFLESRSSVSYTAEMKELLARYKYRGDERLQQVLAWMMITATPTFTQLPMQRKIPQIDVITYVPISQKRLLERGFNQAEQLAAGLGLHWKKPVVPLLMRARHTEKQSHKSRHERLADMQELFQLDQAAVIPSAYTLGRPPRILIIDDVYTTGSTMNECAKIISQQLHADVYGFTWAR
ncbi:MAG: hypothetical protein A2189_10055 [Paenibacillus sp. RIFOXYA1_FULL_44_5]|nr:MAG: hypothetical protein A2189_10055 [Paenibacillus sp. RIFOXYA1_FULL_44_5]